MVAFAWEKVNHFNPEKKGKLVKKDKKRVYFRSRCRVSKRAAQEAYHAAIFSRENENWRGRKFSTKS